MGDLGSVGGPVFDRNGNVGPTVWVDGRVAGGWAQRSDGTIAVELLRPVDRAAERAVDAAAAELASAIGSVRVKQRFPTPLHKELTAAGSTLRR
jgi:hypothetical protein